MSAYTPTDIHRDEAIDHIRKGLVSLAELVVYRCEGWDQVMSDEKQTIQEAYSELVKLFWKLEPYYQSKNG